MVIMTIRICGEEDENYELQMNLAKIHLNHVEGYTTRLEDWLQDSITWEECASKQKDH